MRIICSNPHSHLTPREHVRLPVALMDCVPSASRRAARALQPGVSRLPCSRLHPRLGAGPGSGQALSIGVWNLRLSDTRWRVLSLSPFHRGGSRWGQLPNITKGVYLNPGSLTPEPTLLALPCAVGAQRTIDGQRDEGMNG